MHKTNDDKARDKAFAEHTRTMAALCGAFKQQIMNEHAMVKSHIPDTRDPKVVVMMKGALAELETALLLVDAVENITCRVPEKGEHSVQFRIMAALNKWVTRDGEDRH